MGLDAKIVETKELELFLELSEVLHFGDAGAALHMSPSAVTRAIQRLEAQVGVPLFDRDNRKVSLTAAGLEFRRYARQTLQQWQELQLALAGDAKELRGTVSLFSSVTASYTILARILPTFRAEYPGLELKLHTGDQAEALQRLTRHYEDVAICARPERLPAEIQFQALTSSPVRLIGPRVACPVSAALDAAGENTIPWQQLPFIQPESGVVLQHVQQLFDALAQPPEIYARVSGNEAMVSMVSLGLGVALVPEIVLNKSPLQSSVRVLPLPAPLPAMIIGMATPARNMAKPAIEALWTVAATVYGAYDG